MRERVRGAAFGACLMAGLYCWMILWLPAFRWRDGSLEYRFHVPFAAVVGATLGAFLRHRKDRRIVLLGIWGTGLVVVALSLPGVIASIFKDGPQGIPFLMLLPVFAFFIGLLFCPFTLPCAYLIARFNDPELAGPKRQAVWSWMLVLFALSGLAGAVHHTATRVHFY
jgi:hypothetical protein